MSQKEKIQLQQRPMRSGYLPKEINHKTMRHLFITATAVLLMSFSAGEIKKTTQETYAFNTGLHIDLTEYKKNGKVDNTTEMIMYSHSANTSHFGMEVAPDEEEAVGMVIFDMSINKMITLIDMPGMKTSMSMSFDPEKGKSKGEDIEAQNFTKTGRSKVIMGYSCNEYQTKTEDGTHNFWMSTEAKTGIMSFMLTSQKGLKNMPASYPDGHMLEIENIDKKGKKFVMTVTKYETNLNKQFKMSDYKSFGL